MKRTVTKILCVLLTFTMTAFTLSSCGKKYDVICLEDDKGNILSGFNENMLSFHMAMEKTIFLVTNGSTTDIPELWSMTMKEYAESLGYEAVESVANKTFAEINDAEAIDTAKKMIAAEYLYDTMKGQETVEGKYLADADKKLEAQVDNTVSELQLSIGSKEEFESFISGLGITLEDFRKYYEMSYKVTSLRSALYVSEEEKKEYFRDNYAIVKHILINTNTKTNEAGDKVSLTDAEKQEKLSEVKTIEARIAAGEEFEDIYAEYDGTDPGTAIYSDGYFVTNNNKFMTEFQDAALSMAEGEVRTVYTSYGAHIMKKYPMDAEKYNLYSDINSEINTVLTSAAYTELITPYVEKVKVNEEITSKYSMATVPMMDPEALG